jgi:hypothetical protein
MYLMELKLHTHITPVWVNMLSINIATLALVRNTANMSQTHTKSSLLGFCYSPFLYSSLRYIPSKSKITNFYEHGSVCLLCKKIVTRAQQNQITNSFLLNPTKSEEERFC